jgi:UDP-glucose 4-epimerase
VEDPISSHKANVTATLNVLVAARDAQVKRLVFASSSSVYGDSETLPKVETMPENPLSPYALTKLAGEKYCVVFHRIYGLSAKWYTPIAAQPTCVGYQARSLRVQ